MSSSVVIVNYNTGTMLKDVVDAALKDTSADDIIIIDNNSIDNSMSLLPDDNRLQLHYRKNNYGFASSCNYGAKFAKSDYLLFLNPDCFITSNTIKPLIQDLQQTKNAAIVGCNVNNPDGTEQRASRRRLPTLWRAVKTFSGFEKLARICSCFAGVNLNRLPMPQNTQKVEAISGAFILIKAKIFNKLNGFDENFPLHFEDLDLFKRTIDNGNEILFNPNVSVIHHQGTSSKTNPKVEQFKKQGLQRYFYKHCSYISFFVIKILR